MDLKERRIEKRGDTDNREKEEVRIIGAFKARVIQEIV